MVIRLSKKQVDIITYAQIFLAIFLFSIVIFTLFVVRNANNYEGVYKTNYYIVSNEDVSLNVSSYDIAVVKNAMLEDIAVGEKIAFISRKPNTFAEVVVSKVEFVDIINDKYYFSVETAGSNYTELVSEDDFLGVYSFKLIALSWLLLLTDNFISYLLIMLVPFLLAVLFTLILLKNELRVDKGMDVFKKSSLVKKEEVETVFEPMVEDQDFDENISLKHFMEGLNNQGYQIIDFKTKNPFRPQVVIKDKKIIRFWTNSSSKGGDDVTILGEKYLVALLFNAMIFLNKNENDIFQERLKEVLIKIEHQDYLDKSFQDIIFEIKNGQFKKHYDLIMNYFELIVISKYQFIFNISDIDKSSDDFQKNLKLKNFLDNEIEMFNFVDKVVKYRIFY